MQKVYIAGAHSRARTLSAYLKYLYTDIQVEAYLVNDEDDNAKWIDNIPVVHFTDSSELYTDYPVYIGTRGVYHTKLSAELKKCGFHKIYPVTVELDLQLRNAYLEKYFASVGRTFIKIDQLSCETNSDTENEPERKGRSEDRSGRIQDSQGAHRIYVVRNICDKSLQSPWKQKWYEKEIQAGAALTNQRLSDGILTDDSGENISLRNKQFCELTVLYWLWKNAGDEVIGMVHYRRHFILPEDWFRRMKAHQIDVILPVPLYVAPSIAGNYKSRHDSSDWEFLMEYLLWKNEDIYRSAKDFFDNNLYSPCNMFIMRKAVLDDLCAWLFPILEAVVKHGGQKADNYQNRYPGFISERLISYFFEKNRDKYKLVYADKNFLA